MKTATKATHTPGPWKHFEGSTFITGTYNGIDTPLAEICVLPRKKKFPGYDGLETLTELTEAEEQLNANVLAAAPDMLEALEAEVCSVQCPETCCGKMRAAIAKARGGAA